MNPGFRVRPTAFGGVTVVLAVAAMTWRGTTDAGIAGLAFASTASLVVIGLLWPVTTLGRLRLVVSAPVDGVVGTPITLALDASVPGLAGVAGIRFVDLGDDVFVLDHGRSRISVAPSGRGVWTTLRVSVTSDGPVGMVTVTRTFDVALDRPMRVGPGVDLVGAASSDVSVAPEGASPGGHDAGDQVRSVRPYRVGDSPHDVHWPSTARLGSLVVREFDPPRRELLVVVVDLGSAPADRSEVAARADDRACRVAAGRITAALREGHEVVLCTSEAGVPTTGGVAAPMQAQRRLAAATAGPVGAVPQGTVVPVVVRPVAET